LSLVEEEVEGCLETH